MNPIFKIEQSEDYYGAEVKSEKPWEPEQDVKPSSSPSCISFIVKEEPGVEIKSEQSWEPEQDVEPSSSPSSISFVEKKESGVEVESEKPWEAQQSVKQSYSPCSVIIKEESEEIVVKSETSWEIELENTNQFSSAVNEKSCYLGFVKEEPEKPYQQPIPSEELDEPFLSVKPGSPKTPSSNQPTSKRYKLVYKRDSCNKGHHCGERFVHKSAQLAHTHVHNSVGFHLCNICGVRFSHKKQILLHMRIHERPHVCSKCSKRFTLESDLMFHMRSHDRPHVCIKCSKLFVEEDDLMSHIRLHENSYSCSYFSGGFIG